MKKILFILLVIIVLCTSCGKSVFYEYFSNEENQGYYYATIEITPRNEIIYRGTSSTDYSHKRSERGILKYIYIYGKNEEPPLNDDYISLYSKDFYYLKNVLDKNQYNYKERLDFCLYPKQYWYDEDKQGYLFFSLNKKKDTIEIISRKNILEKHPCFKNEGINWLPKYLTKSKMMDYDKFRQITDVKEKYLKDPRKAPKNLTSY